MKKAKPRSTDTLPPYDQTNISHATPAAELSRPDKDQTSLHVNDATDATTMHKGSTQEDIVDPIGEFIGPYQIVKRIGAGGMGAVYLGERNDDDLKMQVAIKLIRKQQANDDMVQRFRRERQILADLRHPHIAMLLDGGAFGSHPYLIMEYIEGMTVENWCKANKPNLGDMLKMFRKAVAAVGFAHRKGVVHRDIKPGNLMVTPEGEPKLLDFGIARLTQTETTESSEEGKRVIPMTPEYASPEQRWGGLIEATSDLYSMGLVLLHLLTGRSPTLLSKSPLTVVEDLAASTVEDAANQNHKEDLRSTKEFLYSIPVALCHVLRSTLAERVTFRYKNAEQMLADLDRVIGRLPSDTQPDAEKEYDVVLWHHPRDDRHVSVLARYLSAKTRLNVWLGNGATKPSETMDPATLAALSNCRICLVCLGGEDHAPWLTDLNFRDSLSFLADTLRIVPVLLPGALFPQKQSELPHFLRDLPWLTMPEGMTGNAMERVGVALQQDDPDPDANLSGICPFRGLEVFREQDRHFFFGRESVSQRILAHLERHQFIGVLGPSGSGKSSVVQAGVIPNLRESGVAVALLTPAQHPLEELAFAMQTLYQQVDNAHGGGSLLNRLRDSPESLHYMGRELTTAGEFKRILLVVDQFEEIFTLTENPDERDRFVENLCHAVDQNRCVSLLITMRSDFLGKCAPYPNLNKFVLEQAIQVEPMSRRDLARAIETPALLAGLRLENGLLEQILNQIVGSAGELPLLEHALLELYERRMGNLLTLAAYHEIGGIEGALAKRAEAVYQTLNQSQQATLRKMFTLCLVHPGEGAEDTRRRATREELHSIGPSSSDIDHLLDHWTSARLLTASAKDGPHLGMVDVAHEALIHRWPRISEWMNQDRETARLLNRLRRHAQEWQASGRDRDQLLRGAPLLQMIELKEKEGHRLGELELEFVNEGLAARQREVEDREQAARHMKRRKNQAVIAGAFAILVAMIAVLQYIKASRAEQEALSAEVVALAEKTRAESERTRALEQTLEGNYNLGLALNEKAGDALDSGKPQEAWLLSLAALSMEMPPDKSLPEPRGRFVDPGMTGIGKLLWTSPVAPKLVAAALSSDGSSLVLAGRDAFIRVIDTQTGVQTKFLSQARQPVRHMAVSPDGAMLAAASESNQIYLWHLRDDGFQVQDQQHTGQITATEFTHDTQQLVSADDSGLIIIQQQEQSPIQIQLEAGITQLIKIPDGFLAGHHNGAVTSISLAQGHVTSATIKSPGPAAIVGLTPFKAGFAAGDAEGEITLFNATGGITKSIHPVSALNGLSADPGSNTLWLSSPASPIMYFDTATDSITTLDQTPAALNLSARAGFLTGIDQNQNLIHFPLDKPSASTQMMGHGSDVWSLAISPDGATIASCSWDGSITLWDQTGKNQPSRIRVDTGPMYQSEFSPDGRKLAVACHDQKVRVWDLANPTQPLVLSGHQDAVIGVSFSPDSNRLASASWDHTVRIWSLNDTPPRILQGPPARLWGVDWSPDGSRLAAASWDQTVSVWELEGDQPPLILQGHTGIVLDVKFSPDGRKLASSSWDQTVRLWDLDNPRQNHVFKGHSARLYGLAFSPDGKQIASGSWDQTIRLWDVTGKKRAQIFSGHSAPIYSVAFTPDGKALASSSADHTIRLWDLNQAPRPDILRGHEARVYGVTFSPDGTRLASSSEDKTVHLWDLSSDGSRPRILRGHVDSVYDVGFSPNSAQLASSSDHVLLWDLSQPGKPKTLSDRPEGFFGLDFSPDGTRLAAGSQNESIVLWDLANKGAASTLEGHTASVVNVAFSPNGRRLASVSYDTTTRLWDLSGVEPPKVLAGHTAPVYGVAFSPRGDTLATASLDRTVRLWDAYSGAPLQVMRGHRGSAYSVTFSPDGSKLASSSQDRTIRIWNTHDGSEFAVLFGHEGEVNWFMDFSPTGALLATPSDDKTIRLWRMDRFLLPPKGASGLDWYGSLLDRSLYQMGYHLDGYQLLSAPHVRLHSVNAPYRTHPYEHLDRPRPEHKDHVQWLSESR